MASSGTTIDLLLQLAAERESDQPATLPRSARGQTKTPTVAKRLRPQESG